MASMMARLCHFFVLLCTLSVFAVQEADAISTDSKSFFAADWSDPAQAMGELAWRAAKIMLALSPLIAISMLFCCTADDPEEEELRRKKKFDFSLGGGE
eukprot:CAMPEP_0115122990 /NCGR_PEP_ID=MMETSP0227-20121206/47181_1 /TAXON_ID=89957 /ORGANISM="Polarella glacialis, Strain CCMP 1383" /LENGTH=98 /DNA_ID=CAMNT_0002525087 /DNA_START=73 /DNA_END=369 /DNA_ORIENTATION=+